MGACITDDGQLMHPPHERMLLSCLGSLDPRQCTVVDTKPESICDFTLIFVSQPCVEA